MDMKDTADEQVSKEKNASTCTACTYSGAPINTEISALVTSQ